MSWLRSALGIVIALLLPVVLAVAAFAISARSLREQPVALGLAQERIGVPSRASSDDGRADAESSGDSSLRRRRGEDSKGARPGRDGSGSGRDLDAGKGGRAGGSKHREGDDSGSDDRSGSGGDDSGSDDSGSDDSGSDDSGSDDSGSDNSGGDDSGSDDSSGSGGDDYDDD